MHACFMCLFWVCRNVPFAVPYPTAGFSCGGLASPSFSSLHRPADSTGSGSGIFSNLPFVLLQNRPFCLLFSAGHCEERFLVSALIHAVTLARMPPNYIHVAGWPSHSAAPRRAEAALLLLDPPPHNCTQGIAYELCCLNI